MTDDSLLPFSFPAVAGKKITAAFDGGRISSDGGVMLLAQAQRRLGIADRLARVIPDVRDPDRLPIYCPISCAPASSPSPAATRTPTISTGCAPIQGSSSLADNCPDSGTDLCSQPTVSRWENAPTLRNLVRLIGVMIDLYCASYATARDAVTLDIDDTLDVVHGHQQLSLAPSTWHLQIDGKCDELSDAWRYE